MWDVATGRKAFSLEGHKGYVSSLAVSGDGKRIISGSEDGTVRVWDVATGQEAFTLKGNAVPVLTVAISRNGKCIVSGSFDGTLRLWDIRGDRPR